ncbi:helix-turn-helix transcriptional regulator [Oceaniglobus ichthyenteri]|uniref:helix-turn-helix transcriptional regulator n=1 Tax=Oceaniglobus ichthyenteri TaxID=2136177 RepID=UPI000D3A1A4E|nr:LuxR family transcriptional regulator [Oceaniglobus ichthyenteri]
MINHLERLIEATTVEDVWQLHCEKMADYGFDRLLYGFTRFRTATGLGAREDFLIMTNHSGDYAEKFMSDGMYLHAPMVKWALANNGACSWSWWTDHVDSMTKSERQVVEFNRKHGVTAGYSISFRDASIRSKGAIALTAQKGMSQDEVEEIWKHHGRDIIVMNNVAHLKLINLPYSSPARQLTKRQCEALEWVRDGKTTQEAAEIMGLTPATVEKHLRLAREALDVETTAQAVLKATFQNQIFVFEPQPNT